MEKQLLKVYDESETHVGYMVFIKQYVYIPKADFDALSPISLYKKYGEAKLEVTASEVNRDPNWKGLQ